MRKRGTGHKFMCTAGYFEGYSVAVRRWPASHHRALAAARRQQLGGGGSIVCHHTSPPTSHRRAHNRYPVVVSAPNATSSR